MSCYSKHPDKPGVECWHGPGHRGDHGKEDKPWPNLDDPLQIELKRLADENDRLRAERAEVIALLERWEYRHREPSKVASDTRSLLAKLKGQP